MSSFNIEKEIENLYKIQNGNIYKVLIRKRKVPTSFFHQLKFYIVKNKKRKPNINTNFHTAIKNSGQVFCESDKCEDIQIDPI